jgi:hypothetical protein
LLIKTSYWEVVVDTAGIFPMGGKLNYNPNGMDGYDRVRVLQQIIDCYAINGYTETV